MHTNRKAGHRPVLTLGLKAGPISSQAPFPTHKRQVWKSDLLFPSEEPDWLLDCYVPSTRMGSPAQLGGGEAS